MTSPTDRDRELYDECFRHGDRGWELAHDLVMNAIMTARLEERARWRAWVAGGLKPTETPG